MYGIEIEIEIVSADLSFACLCVCTFAEFTLNAYKIIIANAKNCTYFQRIFQKQPKLLPLGTSPAYDTVILYIYFGFTQNYFDYISVGLTRYRSYIDLNSSLNNVFRVEWQ